MYRNHYKVKFFFTSILIKIKYAYYCIPLATWWNMLAILNKGILITNLLFSWHFFIFQLVLKEKLLVQSIFVANCCWNPRINYLYWVYTQIWMYPYMNTRFINLFFRIHQFNMKTSQIVKDNIIELMNIM